MHFGKHKIHVRKIGHKVAHKVALGSKKIGHGADLTGSVVKKVGKLTGQEELVMAGEGIQRGGDVVRKVGKVASGVEKVTRKR